jgi:ribosome-binding protein aMBF1 (putative translation factor)
VADAIGLRRENVPQNNSPSPRPTRRVALLGIAQRSIRLKYDQKSRKERRAKPLPESIQTIGDWIQIKRLAKNLTRCHLALKMGIATSLVCLWEDGTNQPDSQKLTALEKLLGAIPNLLQPTDN